MVSDSSVKGLLFLLWENEPLNLYYIQGNFPVLYCFKIYWEKMPYRRNKFAFVYVERNSFFFFYFISFISELLPLLPEWFSVLFNWESVLVLFSPFYLTCWWNLWESCDWGLSVNYFRLPIWRAITNLSISTWPWVIQSAMPNKQRVVDWYLDMA